MPRRFLLIPAALILLWLGAALVHRGGPARLEPRDRTPEPAPMAAPDEPPAEPDAPVPGDVLLEGYGEAGTPPIDDLRKLDRVITGYFSVVRDVTRHPIGGNADLAACLLGENLNRQRFIRPGHRILGADGLLVDRWGSPLFIHPESARDFTLRSAGPDRIMFTDDDPVILPNGMTP